MKRKPAPGTRRASTGPGERVYAIGDVHGRADLLLQLLDLIVADNWQRGALPLRIILLGDLIDRGPRSADVVESMMLAKDSPHIRFLKGNHEEVFVRVMRGDIGAARFWRQIGGVETLASYGLPPSDQDEMSDAALVEWMFQHIPQAHVDFLDGFEDSIEIGDYVFVHAGLRPGVSISNQKPADLHWIREPFLNHGKPFERVVIHGHSISETIDERPNRIGIDTGAYHSGRLTAIGLQGEERWFLNTGDPL
ncbi:MAG: metallophosphoesterase [Sphingobium sp.]|nr:metallophosphoesterase [Sphingobium sp.]